MNDMRLPGVVPFSADLPATPGLDSTRDPAQAFDAVMSRYAAAERARPNTPAPERSRDTKNNSGTRSESAPPAKATPADKPKSDDTAPQATTANDTQAARGKPAARSDAKDKDADGDDPCDAAAASATTAIDPATLAALATAALQGSAATTTQAAATGTSAEGAKDAAGRPAKDGATANARAVIDALAGRADASAGRGAAKTTDAQAKIEESTDTTAGTTSRRGGLAPKDTLRIDAPLMRAIDVVQAEVAQRAALGSNAPARNALAAAPTLQVDAASPTLVATLAATNSVAAGSTSTYSVMHAAVNAPVGSAAFSDELAQRVTMFASQKLQRADIAVTPADLGPIAVSIEVRGQEATLAFAAASHTTRAAIEDALPRLRDMLSAQGLQLAGAHVGSEPRRDGYRPARNDNGNANSRRTNDGVAAVGTTEAASVRRRVNLIDIEV